MFPGAVDIREFDTVIPLPERLRKSTRSNWADLHLAGAELDAFLEGPVFDADGNLFLVDIPFGRILLLSKEGDWSVVTEYDGWPNGMKLVNERTFLVADNRLGLVEIQRDSGKMSVVSSGFEGKPFHGLNDLTISSGGEIYFTDQGRSGLQDPYGRLFRLASKGELQLLMSGIPSPNGLVLSADEKTLFLAVTRANAIWRLPLAADGSISKAGNFIQLSGGVGPDGLARPRGTDGLVVAQPGLGVWQFGANGLPHVFWQRNGFDYPTNLAEHPAQRGCFYVTESKKAAVLRLTIEPSGAHGSVRKA